MSHGGGLRAQTSPISRRWTSENGCGKVRAHFAFRQARKYRKTNQFTEIEAVSTGKVKADRHTLRAARARLELTQEALGNAAGVSALAVRQLETGKVASHESTREAIQSALEARGIVFTNGDKPGFYFDKTKADIPM